MLNEVASTAQTLTFTQTLKAAPPQVYRAFTSAMMFREWLCDNSLVDARENGSLFLAWNRGYFAAGMYTTLKPDEKIVFSWQGRGEPAATEVDVTLEKQGDETQLTLKQTGIGQGGAWNGSSEHLHDAWKDALENLASYFDTGLDLRIMRRPLLGIYPTNLTAQVAEKLGVPVKEGIQLGGGVLAGSGAEKAGLQKDDVIVSIDGKPTPNGNALTAAVTPHKAGDVIEVAFYRGSEKHTVSMTLSGRQPPDVPWTAEELAERMRQQYAELDSELDAVLNGVTEAEASQKPAPEDWCAKEVLAHLIWTERWMQHAAYGIVGGDDNVAWPDNNPLHIVPILAAFTTVDELAATLKHLEAGSVEMVKSIPDALLANKGSYLRAGQILLNLAPHTRLHFQQMKEAVEAARA
jgi:uncharacterized protein YndB with AHSA1/START domain